MGDLKLQRHGRVVLLSLARNSLNTLSPAFVAELRTALAEVARDDAVGALILASEAEKFFSAGWDLPVVLDLDPADMRSFYRSFSDLVVDLATQPQPTFAELGGIAVAGGCMVALACDWRVASSGCRRFGLNEVDLGVPVPWVGVRLALEVAGWRAARDTIVGGALVAPEVALASGLLDAVEEAELLRDVVLDRAEAMAAKPGRAGRLAKAGLREGLRESFEAVRSQDEESFLEAWTADAARPLLAAAARKLVPRPPDG